MHRLGIGGGVDRHGRNSQFATGALDTKGDLASVGDQDFLKQQLIPE
jgi:hypothetical protein